MRVPSIRSLPPGVRVTGRLFAVTFAMMTLATLNRASAGNCNGQGNAQLALLNQPAPGTTLELSLTGRPLSKYAILADVGPGPTPVPGVGTLCLDLGPQFKILVDGIRQGSPRLASDGTANVSLRVPARPSLGGRTFYVQAAISDSQAPNGIAISNMVTVTSRRSIVERFDTIARRDGQMTSARWTGDGDVVGTVARTPRQVTVSPPESGFALPQPLVSMNDQVLTGCRFQTKFSPSVLGLIPGESIFGMSWSPRSGFLFASTYTDMTMKLGHFDRVPIQSMSTFFDQNYRIDEPPVTVFSGNYTMTNASNISWYPWPAFSAPFEYDSSRSLMFEVEIPTGGATFQLFQNYSASVWPLNRIYANAGDIVAINNAEDTIYWTRFMVIQNRAFAQSKFIDTGSVAPDFHDALLTITDEPTGTAVEVLFEGAQNVSDTNTYTGFQSDIDRIDGSRFFRFRIVLHGNTGNGAVATASKLIVPFD